MLGIFAELPDEGFAAIKPWEGKKIPSLDEATPLTKSNAVELNEFKPLKLNSGSEGLIEKRINLESLGTEMQLKGGKL